jgi:hypothetical protein
MAYEVPHIEKSQDGLLDGALMTGPTLWQFFNFRWLLMISTCAPMPGSSSQHHSLLPPELHPPFYEKLLNLAVAIRSTNTYCFYPGNLVKAVLFLRLRQLFDERGACGPVEWRSTVL